MRTHPNVFSTKVEKRLQRSLTVVALMSLFTFLLVPGIKVANAATMAQIKWTQGRIKASTAADSVSIQFTVPTGVDASTDTITLTFDSGVVLASEAAVNFDFEVGDSGTCSTASFTDKTLSLTAGAATWGVDVTGQVITLTAPTDAGAGEITAGRCVDLKIGTNATSGGTGSGSALTNGTAANYDVDITSELGAIDDSGSGSISIIAEDQIVISATVDPSITFTLGTTAVSFGTITTGTGRWATSGGGGNASAALPTSAHQMTIATNAASGWSITYLGNTLTSGSNTICQATDTPSNGSDCVNATDDSDGAPGTEQFGLSLSTDGNSTIPAGYLRDSAASFEFLHNTTTSIISESVATNTETIDISYLGNIAGSTQAGTYNTTLTYIASATF